MGNKIRYVFLIAILLRDGLSWNSDCRKKCSKNFSLAIQFIEYNCLLRLEHLAVYVFVIKIITLCEGNFYLPSVGTPHSSGSLLHEMTFDRKCIFHQLEFQENLPLNAIFVQESCFCRKMCFNQINLTFNDSSASISVEIQS